MNSFMILGRWSHMVVRRADDRARLEGAVSAALVEVSRQTPAGVLAYRDDAWLPCADADEAARLRARGYEVCSVIVEAAP